LVVATLTGESVAFIENLRRQLPSDVVPGIHIFGNETDLHEKGLVGDDFYIAGSMNFTYRGVTLNQEMVTVFTAPDSVAMARLAFFDRYGGRV
jgi:phosphatidylserine/phosphatidylglycerophosphate/cardiolipin synthase-like enzyme